MRTASPSRRWLERHPAVEKVFYPGLASHPDHERARQLFSGFGGVVSLMVRGGDDAALGVTQRLRLMCVAPSLGGVETLVSMPRFTSHAALSREERHAIGVGDGFIRLALGIEDSADLIADLEQALAPLADRAAGRRRGAALTMTGRRGRVRLMAVAHSTWPSAARGPCGIAASRRGAPGGSACLFDKSCVVASIAGTRRG
jgi:hypothetical protein